MPTREETRKELTELRTALVKAREANDEQAVVLFTRDINVALVRLGWERWM
jgi:hypothetical protein